MKSSIGVVFVAAVFTAACSHTAVALKSERPAVKQPLPPEPDEVDPSGVYRDVSFGLEAQVPTDFRALTAKPGGQVVLLRSGTAPAVAALLFVRDLPPQGGKDALFFSTANALAFQLGQGHTVREVGKQSVALALGPAEERQFEVDNARFQLRVTVVPMCEEASGLLFVTTWTDEAGKQATDAWMKSFERRSENPPVCQRKIAWRTGTNASSAPR